MKKKHLILSIVFSLLVAAQIVNAQSIKPDDALVKKLTDTSSLAQPDSLNKPWKFSGVTSLNLTQSAFVNWSAGGQNSIAVNALVSLAAKYKKGIFAWDNNLDLGYGLMQQGTEGLRKTDDRIEFSSKLGVEASKHWYYSALVNFKTQFYKGYNYPDDSTVISNFLAPAYFIGAIGMDYKPHPVFSAFLSPVTARMTIVNDDALSAVGAFGVKPGHILRTEAGAYVRLMYNQSFWNSAVSIQSKLELFSSYYNGETDRALRAKPQNIDVNWETIVNFKVTKFISATINTQLVYDDDIKIIETLPDGTTQTRGARIQFKEVIGVGFLYKF